MALGPGGGRCVSRGAVSSALFVLVLVPACFGSCDECQLGDERCEGSKRLVCEHRGCHTPGCVPADRWKSEACEHACLELDGEALCVLSIEPDQHCAGDVHKHCEGGRVIECDRGLGREGPDCSAQGQVCVETQDSAQCTLFAEPDPGCQAARDWDAVYCVSPRIVGCAGDFVQWLIDCPFSCVGRNEQHFSPRCAASTELDPDCEGAETPVSPKCPDGTRGACQQGYLLCPEHNERQWSAPARRDRDSGIPTDSDAGR